MQANAVDFTQRLRRRHRRDQGQRPAMASGRLRGCLQLATHG